MTTKRTLLSTFFLFLTIGLFSQVEIIGEMRLGDTTQVHIITTKNGDRMVGRVVGFDESEIKFLMLGNNLTFAISEIEKILVESKNGNGDTSDSIARRNPFLYRILTRNGKEYEGELLNHEYGMFIFETREKGRVALKTKSIFSLWLLGENMSEKDSMANQYHRLILKNGQEWEGQVVNFDKGKWAFMTRTGNMNYVSKNEVSQIDLMVKDETYGWYKPILTEYPYEYTYRATTKTFFSPTGFMLKKGESEYRNTEIFFNNVEYGISDYVNVGAAFSPILTANLIGAKIKLGAPISDKFHIATGGQIMYAFGNNIDRGTFTVFYGAMTLGTESNNLTLSIGRLKDPDDVYYSTITLAGSIRAGRKTRFFVEYNRWIDIEYNDDYNIINTGMSWFRKSNRIDFGITILGESGYVVPFPIAAYSHYF